MPVRNQSNEALARVRIDNTLKGLGWRLDGDKDGPANVVFERNLKSSGDVERLEGKSPDYTLYDEDDNIIGLVEAKTARFKVTDGLKQCFGYAKKLRLKEAICFCSDGNITHARHVNGEELRINGEIVEDLLSVNHVKELAKNPDLNLGDEIRSITQLVRLFNDSQDVLRDDGVEAGLDSLREFCLLLFVKVMTERRTALPGCEWEEIVDRSGKSLMVTYKRIVDEYRKKYPEIFRGTAIRTPATLRSLIEGIKDINFSRSNLDIKGGAYEHFLAKYNTQKKSVLGQYFTPRHITRMLAKLMDFRLGKTIYDPFCGTGGMLISCYTSLYNQARGASQIKNINQKTLYGRDLSSAAAQLAKMNMVLIGDGHSNIVREDSFANYVEQEYDAVITNIPFGLPRRSTEVADMYGSGFTHTSEVAVLHCMHAIRKGGQAAIILPDTLAYASQHEGFRDYVAKNAKIRAIIRLPDHAFKPYTTARTFVLLLENIWAGTTTRFPFVHIKNDGFSNSTLREPIYKNDITELLDNAHDIGGHYQKHIRIGKGGGGWYPESIEFTNEKDSWKLAELLDVNTEKTRLQANEEYVEPLLDSYHNKIKPKREPRLGRNLPERKIIAHPGDLIIGTLHTQSANGLFAISDGEYICESQIVAKIKEEIINKHYLLLMLRRQFPKLIANDLVGRETFTHEQILSVRIPKIESMSKKKQEMLARYIASCEAREQADIQAKAIQREIF